METMFHECVNIDGHIVRRRSQRNLSGSQDLVKTVTQRGMLFDKIEAGAEFMLRPSHLCLSMA